MPALPPLAPRGLQYALITFAIRFRGVTLALAFTILGYGALSVVNASYDVFPEFAPPQVSIQTEAPGLTPEQVEVLVTQPIENAIHAVPGIQALRSASVQGLSIIAVIFANGSDIYRNRQVVAEQLTAALAELPAGVKRPVLNPLTSSSSTVLVLGLTSQTRSLMDIRTAADWTLAPRLLAVPGVAKAAVFGGEVRSIQVQVHPDQLIRYNLTMSDVLAAAKNATAVRGAGFIEGSNQRIALQTGGQAKTPEQAARTVVATSGEASVLLRDVASVISASEPPIGGAAIMGKPGVVLVVSAQFGANTIEVTDRVEAALAGLRPALEKEGMTLHANLFRPADFIAISTTNVQGSLLLGGALVVAVLFLFLFDIRAAAISCMAIPLSLLVSVIVMNALGVSLNAMTLGGLAIAIGEVVDDAVIDVENILRRLRENRLLASPLPVGRVILNASLEVRGAVVYATFAVVLVFLPVLALPGLAGRFFAPLALAYILAILASLAAALTVTPALCMLLFAKSPAAANAGLLHDPPLTRWLGRFYERLLRPIVAAPGMTAAAALAVTTAGCGVLPFFSTTFLPELQEGHFILHMSAVPGTSIPESLRIGAEVTRILTGLPGVRMVSQRVGRAEKADDTWGPHYSEFEVDLKKDLSADETDNLRDAARNALSQIAGVNFLVKAFLTERVEESLSGSAAPVAVNVYGNDLDAIDRTAAHIARILNTIPGARDVQLQSPPGLPLLQVNLRRPDLERWGLGPAEVLEYLRTAYQGDIVGQVYEGNRVFNVITILDPESRRSIAKLANLPLRRPSGAYVLLGQIADIQQTAGRYQILHLGGQRVQAVTANVSGRNLSPYVAKARAAIAEQVHLPPGVYIDYTGSAEAQKKSARSLTINAGFALIGILVLLSVVTGSWRNLILILANLPFALVGGVLAVFATGGLLSLGSMVGFVTLFGITLRNSIMMISHYEHLVSSEGHTWDPSTAVRGARERLAPVLMTSIVTALGLLPLALGMNEPGREIDGPMAMVIVGGLFTSMILNLLVLPALALRYGRFERRPDVLDSNTPASLLEGAG
jgi:CzcA family heavy metal efflux pump